MMIAKAKITKIGTVKVFENGVIIAEGWEFDCQNRSDIPSVSPTGEGLIAGYTLGELKKIGETAIADGSPLIMDVSIRIGTPEEAEDFEPDLVVEYTVEN